jgi:RHS repeat-associated protein
MLTKRYDTINGRIRSESSGGVRTGYLPDALGNVTATVQDGAIVNTYRYKPSGALLSKTGAGDDPKFQWNGTHGYRQTGVPIADTYIRARHYARQAGQWTSTDPMEGQRQHYVYANASPTTRIDPDGLTPRFDPSCQGVIPKPDQDEALGCHTLICRALKDTEKRRAIMECLNSRGLKFDHTEKCLDEWCIPLPYRWRTHRIYCDDCRKTSTITCHTPCEPPKTYPAPGMCADPACFPGDVFVGDIRICSFWFNMPECKGKWDRTCGPFPSSLSLIVIHEALHFCSVCTEPKPEVLHPKFNCAVECIMKIAGCKTPGWCKE